MNWYSHMMKSYEIARAQNQRMERRMQGERFGPDFMAQARLAALDKEKKLIQRELERIRKGIHRPPKVGASSLKNTHVLAVNSPRNLPSMETDYANNSIDPEYSSDENKLYDAILFLQNNPSALVPILAAHSRSDAYLETLERISPRFAQDDTEKTYTQQKSTFVPRYLQERATKAEKSELLNKYTSLLHRHSPVLRKSSPHLKTLKPNDTFRPRKYSPLASDDVTTILPPIERRIDNDDSTDGTLNTDAVRFL